MSAFGMITTTSMLEQASTEMVIMSAVHCALLAAVPWLLIINAVVCTDLIE